MRASAGKKVESEPKKREIEVRIISAQDLEDVKHLGKMRTYAVVYIDPHHKVTTPTDQDGGINPTWNQKLLLQADDEIISEPLAALNVDIYAHGHIRDKLVGTARALISEVLKGGDAADPSDNPIQCIAVQVRRPSGRPQGILNLWIPPTGKFLVHRNSLSLSKKEPAQVAPDENGLDGGAGGTESAIKQSQVDGDEDDLELDDGTTRPIKAE